MNSKRIISFSVRSEAEKDLYANMAVIQGFTKLSDFARFAFKQYIKRYNLAKRIAVQQDASEEEKAILQEFE